MMKKFFADFKKFIFERDVVSLAIAVVVGGAFTQLVKSIVDNIISPIIGAITVGVDFSTLKVKILNVEFTYGAFINTLINFLLTLFVIFIIIEIFTKLKEKMVPEKTQEDTVMEAVDILVEIRDLLKEQKK